MKFIINRETLLPSLQQIVSVIEKRQTMPILANVLVHLHNNRLTLTGTDLEIQMIAHLPIDSDEQMSLTIPARKFLDICRFLPNNADITVESHDDKVKITSGRSRYSLSTFSADVFPSFEQHNYQQSFTINAGKFKKGLEKTSFCMASQDVRYYLNGVFLNISNDKFKCVGSDGHRLALYEDTLDVETGYEARVILPKKSVTELNRLLDDPDAELLVDFSANNIRITFKDIVFISKLVDAKYPDFSKVFQQTFFDPIIIDKHSFKDALTRVAIVVNSNANKGVLFDIDKNDIVISSQNSEQDEAEDKIAIDYLGEPFSIAFNVQYMLDATNNIDSDQVLFTVASNASSCFLCEPDESGYRYVIMPMRL